MNMASKTIPGPTENVITFVFAFFFAFFCVVFQEHEQETRAVCDAKWLRTCSLSSSSVVYVRTNLRT